MDLLESSRSLMEGERERELLFCFGRARMSRRKKIAIGEEEDGYKYPLSPNGHLSRGSAALRLCLSVGAALPHQAR